MCTMSVRLQTDPVLLQPWPPLSQIVLIYFHKGNFPPAQRPHGGKRHVVSEANKHKKITAFIYLLILKWFFAHSLAQKASHGQLCPL